MPTFKRCERAEQAFRNAFEAFHTHEYKAAERFLSNSRGMAYFAAKDVQLEGGMRRETAFFTLGKRVESALATAMRLTTEKKCELQLCVSSSLYSSCTGDDGMAYFITFDKKPKLGPEMFLETGGQGINPQDVKKFNETILALHDNWPGRRTRGPMRELLEIIRDTSKMKNTMPVLTLHDNEVWRPELQPTDRELDYLARLIKVYGLGTADMVYMHGIPMRKPGYLWFHTHINDDTISNSDLLDVKGGTLWQKSRVMTSIQMIGRQEVENNFDMFIFPFFRHEKIGTLQPFMLRAAYLHDQYNNRHEYPPTVESAEVLGSIMDMHPAMQEQEKAEEGLCEFRKAIEARESVDSLVAKWNAMVALMGKVITGFPHKDWKELMREINGGAIELDS
jgi:hypothetical protein